MMNQDQLKSFRIAIALLMAASSAVFGLDTPLKVVHGHVADLPPGLTAKGQMPAASQLHLAIGLPLRDEAGLDAFLAQVYDPASTNFHHYLTPEEFTQRFGPTEADYQALKDFAETNGLAVTGTSDNRLLLDVDGSVQNIQRALHLTLRTYQHPTEAREFFAPDTEPSVDARLPIRDVSGLNNYILPHPRIRKMDPAIGSGSVAPRTGSSPTGAYMGKDFRAAYVPGVTLNGAGQSVGLLEFDGFYASDITAYETAAGLPNVPMQTILLDGYNGVPHSGNDEVSLDIEMTISMAPGLSKVVLFEAGPGGLPNDVLNSMVANSQVKQFSCSWGWGGGPSGTTDSIFKQMAAQGQSFFTASGDSDAYTTGAKSSNGVDNTSLGNAPSSSPYITVVGGTTLNTTGPGGSWSSETVWNWGLHKGSYAGSSGGISSYYSIPSWQSGISMSANSGSTTQRNLPDVAMAADNVYVLYGNGASTGLGGTSCATPLWAGFVALVNQQAQAAGKLPVGFVNPAIYAIGKGSTYQSNFHDITSGNNVSAASPNLFYAAAGYDLCTGWGTPSGQALIDSLSGAANSLSVSPINGFTFGGAMTGPFTPTSGILTLSNSGATAISWTLMNTSAWLQVSASAGTLASASASQITASLTDAAFDMVPGTYDASLIFTNQASGAITIPSTLLVGQSVLQNGDFEAGDFSGWTLVGNTTLAGNIYNAVENTTSGFTTTHSGTYGAFLGDTNLASLSQTFSTVPGQFYLLSLWLDNPASGTGQRFILSWQTNGGPAQTLFSITSPPAFTWTNLQFLVGSSGANATVRLQAENDSNYFGVDDVKAVPIPAPSFQSASKTANGLQLSWATAVGLVYQVQYKTNLMQPDWIDLGNSFQATTYSSSVLDPAAVGSSPQRFYRLMVAP
jgi:subtilase family serine protease